MISGHIMIQVLNSSPAPVNKNVIIGTVKPVQAFCCKVPSTGLQEVRNNLVEEWIARMLEKAVTQGNKERQRAKELLHEFKNIIVYQMMIFVAQDCCIII